MNSPLPIGVTYDSPYALVKEHFELPFELYPFQQEDVNALAPLTASGEWADPGLGKTAISTACAFFKMALNEARQVVVLMPPILDRTWRNWLAKLRRRDGRPITVLSYRGTPKERAKMKFDTDFILMSVQIFKKDYDRIVRELGTRRLHVILDEAHVVKNVGSDNYKYYRDFVAGQSHQMLSGTPLTTPMDGYAYVKLLAPSVYRNLAQFKRIHIESENFFGQPETWQNLDLLRENMSINASFRRKEDLLLDLPPKIVNPIEYDLDKQHLALYRKLVDEQLLALPDGKKIDVTQVTALRHALGQVVLSWGHFAGDDSKVPKGLDLVEEVMDEIGDAKLVVFANYRRSNAAIVKHFADKYGAVGVWGDVSPKDKERNLARFLDDPKCRMITLQPISAGIGIDGLQEVSSDCLFLEPPITPKDYNQALSRLWRDGQRKVTNVRLAVAHGTLQVKDVERLVEKEELVNPLQYSKAELRAALLGG